MISVSDSDPIIPSGYGYYPKFNIMSVATNHTDNSFLRAVLDTNGSVKLRTVSGAVISSGAKTICCSFAYGI